MNKHLIMFFMAIQTKLELIDVHLTERQFGKAEDVFMELKSEIDNVINTLEKL